MRKLLPLLCLTALLFATPAAADLRPVPLNCHEMTELFFGGQDNAQLLSASDSPEEAALADYFTAREAAYRGDTRLLSGGDDWNAGASVAESNELRAQRVREMETRLDMEVLDADVTARIERESTTRNSDGTWTLYVYEWTFYDYDDLADGAGGLDVSGFGTWHILTVKERPDGSFEILSDEYDESDVLGVNTLSPERMRELAENAVEEPEYDPAPEDDASLLAFSYYPDYNVQAAVEYSERYWGGIPGETYNPGDKYDGEDNYNKEYASFNRDGGDCANFTSQCIYAGGMPQVVTKPYSNDGWYYKSSNDRSATWTGATNLHHWMRDNRGRCVTASKSTVFTGSPVFYSKTGYPNAEAREKKTNISFAHAVLCVGTNSAGTPIINSHNTNRWHAMWNYYTGSVDIDTVQLTSNSFGTFSGYVKLDADFYAYIINPSLNRYVTNDGGGKVTSRVRTEQSGQVWRFLRQDDGSYEICSLLRGETTSNPVLAAQENGWASRTPVCIESYDAEPGQQWYIYWTSGDFAWGKGAYQLRPKCSDRVMDIVEGKADEGTELWIFSRNGSDAQLFQLYQTTWITIDKPVLQYVLEGGEGANVKFSWESLTGAASYVLRVTQGDAQVSSATVRRNTSYALKLEPGEYQATVEAVSADERASTLSDPITFNVYTSFSITYDANGGTDAPEEQIKIERQDIALSETVPVYPGHTFSAWNTLPNGAGDSYQPGEVCDKNEDLTLYAQWELTRYAVTLNPVQGVLLNDTVTVTYSEPYGELPAPTRDQHEFSGWYTEPDGGERITEQSIVTLTEDHTLYAHWESTVAYISSIVTRSDTYHMVHTTAYRVTNGILFACGYSNGQMLDAASVAVGNGQAEDLALEGDFDTIRVFALDKNTFKPLCPCNVVPARNFRG